MKKVFRELCARGYVKTAAGASALVAATGANAALDLTQVETGINNAVTSGETVGGYVVIGVAALVVIGIVLAVIRKMG